MLLFQSTAQELSECVDLLLKLNEPAASLYEEYLAQWVCLYSVAWRTISCHMEVMVVSCVNYFLLSLDLIHIWFVFSAQEKLSEDLNELQKQIELKQAGPEVDNTDISILSVVCMHILQSAVNTYIKTYIIL